MYSVLIVDDEAIQREYLRLQIPALDGRFVIAGEAADGQEALEFLERTPVDLLVTDIKMPVMNGLELCRRAYARDSRMKIVILTGYEEFEFVREALKYKAEQYLLKPLNREATRAALAELAAQLERTRADEAALRALRALSEEARRQVARRFLQAQIAGSQAEIGALFPLTCRMNIPLFEGEGVLLLLEIDETSLRDRQIPPREFAVFRYILNQIAAELAEPRELAWTLFDDRERTAILLSGTEPAARKPAARALFAQIRDQFRAATGLTLTGGLGAQIEDVLQLELSYRSALAATYRRFRGGGGRLYEADGGRDGEQTSGAAADEGAEGSAAGSRANGGGTAASAAKGKEEESETAAAVDSFLQLVRAAVFDPHSDGRLLGVSLLADLLARDGAVPAAAAFGFGAFLLQELGRGPVRRTPEAGDRAWRKLAELLPPEAPPRTLVAVQEAYQSALAEWQDAAGRRARSGRPTTASSG